MKPSCIFGYWHRIPPTVLTHILTFCSAVVGVGAGCEQKPQDPPTKSEVTSQKSRGTMQASEDLRGVASQIEDQTSADRSQLSIHFTDITADSGIHATITCGSMPTSEILEVNGGGLAFIDFDNDGDLDLFVANGATLDSPEQGPGSRLFENLGQFHFRDITAEAGIDVYRWASGVAVGDYDGDGFDDLYICCYGPNILLRNNGNRTFTDVTGWAFGDQAQSSIPKWSTSAAFGDLDNDGDLDLYVCNYLDFDLSNRPAKSTFKGVDVMGGPHGLPPQHDVLYRNNGDGTFEDVSVRSGCRSVKPSFGLNVLIADFDDDGWQDITVANDSMPDFLFHNTGRTKDRGLETEQSAASPIFQEIGVISGLAANADGSNQASMGLAIADVDGNGQPDKFTTVFSSDVNALHMNQSAGPGPRQAEDASQGTVFFEDRAQQYGLAMVSRPYLGWSAGFYDFDHDGDEDLLFVNGHVYPQARLDTMDSEYEQPPLLFERDGARFKRVMADRGGAWLAKKHRDRNAIFADLDRDGDIDVIIGELNGPIRVLRNDAGVRNWLIVELNDMRPDTKNHRGLGAKFELRIVGNHSEPARPRADGETANIESTQAVETVMTRWLSTGGGFQSSGAHYVHFGLGDLDSVTRLEVTITWPDGHRQQLDGVQLNQHLIVRRAE